MTSQPQAASEQLPQKDKIAVLSKEYDTLRAEIVARTTNCYQVWAATAAAITWLSGRPIEWTLWTLSATLALIFVGVLGALYRDINALSERVSIIERKINDLAGGEELLEWETRWGGASPNGWFCRKRSRK